MSIDLANYEEQTRKAVQTFWVSRSSATEGNDYGERGNVTGGKNMDGFLDIVRNIVINNGLSDFDLHISQSLYLTLPGFFGQQKDGMFSSSTRVSW